MIVPLLISLFSVLGFGIGLWLTNIAELAQRATRTTVAGISAMLDPDLDDDAKEVEVRRSGVALILAALKLFFCFAIIIAVAAIPIVAADLLDLATPDEVLSLMLRLEYIAIVSVVAIAISEIVRRTRKRGEPDISSENRYSYGDQTVHLFAFSSPSVLKGASWFEDRLIQGPKVTASEKPIFVTSLARGGTTALLNAMYSIPSVATHLYRDMPFLTSPLLWNRLAGGSKRQVKRQERAHGDGLEIDLDTPEAFEEVIWKMHWPEKYGRGIEMWREQDRLPTAERFIERHMEKIVQARRKQGRTEASIYCSKNNTNIARIPLLKSMFPEGRIIVVLRRPECHAASLLRQHRNFIERQQEDAFVKRYMRDIGHFEFGQIHNPILFPGFNLDSYEPLSEDYWLNYWNRAFESVLQCKESCIFVSQDDLRAHPKRTMSRVCMETGTDSTGLDFDGFFRSGPDVVDRHRFCNRLLSEADEIYGELISAPENVIFKGESKS